MQNQHLSPQKCDLPLNWRLMFKTLFYFHNNLVCTVIYHERLLPICKKCQDVFLRCLIADRFTD